MTRTERRLAAGLVLVAAVIVSRGSPALRGDAPYYLATTHSILRDGNLDLRNELREPGRFAFQREARPTFARQDPQGRLVPSQGIGFSAGIAPVYALVTWTAAALPDRWLTAVRWSRARAIRDLMTVALALMAGWVAVLSLRLINRVTSGVQKSWAVVAVAFLTPPLLLSSLQPVPEMAAALLVIWFVLEQRRAPYRPIVAALPLMLLPWFHLRFALVAVCGAAWILRRSPAAALLPALSLTAFIGFTWITFGTWWPPPFPDELALSAGGWIASLAAPFTSLDSGLLWVAPFWLFALAGLSAAAPTAQTHGKFTVSAIVSLLLLGSVFSNGHERTSPGATLAPALPILLPFVAAGLERARTVIASRSGRFRLVSAMRNLALAWTAFYGLLILAEPSRATSEPGQGIGRLPQTALRSARAQFEPPAQLRRLGLKNDHDGFLESIRTANLDALRLYLEAGHNPNAGVLASAEARQLGSLTMLLETGRVSGTDAARALAKARETGATDFVDALSAAGITLDSADGFGETALMLTIREGRSDERALLIRLGANLDAVSHTRETALAIAVLANQRESVDELLVAGANPNLADLDGWSPLMTAVRLGRTGFIQALLARGADVNARSRIGWTALMWSANDGSEPITQLLIKAGADVNASSAAGQTALIRAAGQGRLDVVRSLLVAGADKSIAINGATARDWAVRNGHAAVVELLAVPGTRH